MSYRKHLVISSAVSVCLLGGFAVADEGRTGPRDGTGPERIEGVNTGNALSGDQMVGNRDESQTRDMTGGDADAKVNAILDQIKQSPEKAGEKLFVLEAAMGNQWEIEFSRLAEQKAQDPKVKELARMMASEHKQAQQRLMAVAQQMNLDLPSSLPPGKQKKLEVIGSLPADKFEACYLMMLKADHAKAITNYADHQVVLQDEAVKSYIGEVLPKLREHGSHVVEVASAKGIGSGDLALGGEGHDHDAMGSPDQAQDREANRQNDRTTTDTNRKPTDTTPSPR